MANTSNLDLERANFAIVNGPGYLERVDDDRVENSNVDKIDAFAGQMLFASASFAYMANVTVYASMSMNAEADNKIRVIGQIKKGDGVNVTIETPMLVKTTAPSTNQGQVDVVSGTLAFTGSHGGVGSSFYTIMMTSAASGTFVIDVNDTNAESVALEVIPDDGLSRVRQLTFA